MEAKIKKEANEYERKMWKLLGKEGENIILEPVQINFYMYLHDRKFMITAYEQIPRKPVLMDNIINKSGRGRDSEGNLELKRN